MSFLRNLFRKKPPATTSSSDERSAPEDPEWWAKPTLKVRELKAKHDVKGLIEALSDEWAAVAATEALREIGAPAIQLLATSLKSQDSILVRQFIVEILSDIGDDQAVELLIGALEDQSEKVRFTAAVGLRRFRDPRTIEPFVMALKDETPEVRVAAVMGLGNLADTRVVQPLITALLTDQFFNVRSL